MEEFMSQDKTNPRLPQSSDDAGQRNANQARRTDYEVGYGKPPKPTQFKPGQSGNPKGAKKKVAIDDVRTMVEDVLAAPVTLRDGGKSLNVSRLEAMLRTQRHNALKGDSKAAKAIFKLSQKAGMFSKAKRKGTMVIDPAGGTPEERMLLRAFHAEQDSQQLDGLETSDGRGSDRK
jgi:hypothetical protein